jgi:thioesterase domain-containing protein/acyl carrier protein
MLPEERSNPGPAAAFAPSPAAIQGRFGLTSPQMAIWLDQALHPQKAIYNTGQTLTISAALDLGHFAEALRIVIAENDALRLRFSQRGSEISQEVVEDIEHGLEVRDFSSQSDPEACALAWLEQVFWRPLTPADFPLFRFAVAKLAARRYIWLQKYHHLIIDATGRQIVAARVATVYDALSRGERPPPCGNSSYRIAKESEGAYLESDQYAADQAHWVLRFHDVPQPLVRTPVALSEKSRSGRPVRLHFPLTGLEWSRLREFARARDSSPFKVICGLAWSLFSRLYDNPEPVFGVALANRMGPDAKRTVGLFSRVMPFRLQIDPAMPFSAALAALDAQLADDLKHQRFPTDRIHGSLQLRRLGRDGLFDVVVNYIRNDYGFELGGAPVTCINLSSGFASPMNIMALEYGADGLNLVIDYDPGRISSDEANMIFRSLRQMLIAVPDAADVPIGRLPLANDSESAPSAGPILLAQFTAESAPNGAGLVPDHFHQTALEVWRDVFADTTIDSDANFFDLGGDSLKAVFVVGECNARFAIDLPLTVLFEQPTIVGFVNACRNAADTGASSRLVQLKAGGSQPPLLLIHPVGGSVFCYRELVSRLPNDTPVYGMQAAGLGLGEQLPDSIEEMAADYLRAASAQLGDGPWHLAGWSFGGLVAFEMALQLAESGRALASLTLVDTPVRSTLELEEDERSVLIAVAGAFGADLAGTSLENAALSIADLVSNATLRAGVPALSEEQVERTAALVRNLRRLRRKYRPRPFAGPILLLRAASDPSVFEDAFDWSAFGRVTTIAIPATHHTIVFPPYVNNVATIFTSVLGGNWAGSHA